MTPKIKEDLKQINKQIKSKVRQIKNKILKSTGKELNEAKQQRKLVKLWKQAKSQGCSKLTKAPSLQCPGIGSYFKRHFNPDHSSLETPSELLNTPQYIRVLQDSNLDIINQPPSQDEIKIATNQLNNGKSSLDIEAEIIKVASTVPEFIENIENYFEKIWTTKQIPEQWTISRITAIWKKKGNAFDPSKYRGIYIGSALCKIGMNVILRRLSHFYENQLKRTQFGFRSGTGCNDGIYMLKQLQDISSLSQRKLYICFVDLTAAFDHINRDLLFKTIRNRLPANQATTNIDIIEQLYQSTKSYIQNDDPEKDNFQTTSGVRQGGMEGPPLYNLYADYAIRVYEDRKNNAGITGLNISYSIPNEATSREQRAIAPSYGSCDDDNCGYADDLGVICWSKEDLQNCMNILFTVFNEYGLTINTDKTETMITNWNDLVDGHYPTSIVSLNGKTLKNVISFKYLGVWITNNCLHIGKQEMEHRINSAHNAFAENRNLLTNKNIHLNTRIMFLNSLVRSRLTYGCHAWKPNSQEINKIDSTYRYFLRCMVWNGHTRKNPPPREETNSSDDLSDDSVLFNENDYDWSYIISNESLYRITKTNTIKEFHQQQQINWIAHVIRRQNNNVNKMLTFHTVKRSRRGRKIPSILDRAVQNSGLSFSEFLRTSFLKRNCQQVL